MTKSDLSEKEIQELKRENDILRRENKYLRNLTNSKRFRFAEKIANGYNGIFPKNTKRRNIVSKTAKLMSKPIVLRNNRRDRKIQQKVNKLATRYDNVIVLNSIPWDIKLKQRPHHFAREFSKAGFLVIYLEFDNPLKRFRVVGDGVVTVNSVEYLDEIPKIAKNCYFLSPNNMPTKFAVLKREVDLGYKLIYDYLDEFHEDISGDLNIQMEVWDRLLELKPVLCLATAKRLYDDLTKHLGKSQEVVMASNAVNIEHFNFQKNKESAPGDLKEVLKRKKPVVGFYGALAPWIDFELLNKIAKKHAEWEFVYLGSDYGNAAKDLSVGENVHNLGVKNYEVLPKYTRYFDCAMIPFKKGEIAKATSPVKLFEYMAAGLPTVCTRDLKECDGYKYVYMSNSDEEFEKNIAKAISDHKDEKKRLVLLSQAKKNTWAERVRVILEALD